MIRETTSHVLYEAGQEMGDTHGAKLALKMKECVQK